MSDDLVKRLRDLGDHASFEPHMHHTAADRIEELENELGHIKETSAYGAGYSAGYSDAEKEQSKTATGRYVDFVCKQNLKLKTKLTKTERLLSEALFALDLIGYLRDDEAYTADKKTARETHARLTKRMK